MNEKQEKQGQGSHDDDSVWAILLLSQLCPLRFFKNLSSDFLCDASICEKNAWELGSSRCDQVRQGGTTGGTADDFSSFLYETFGFCPWFQLGVETLLIVGKYACLINKTLLNLPFRSVFRILVGQGGTRCDKVGQGGTRWDTESWKCS